MRKLLLLLVLALLPPLGNPVWGQTPAIGVNASEKQPHDGATGGKNTKDRGAKENPLVVDTMGSQQTEVERKEAEQQAAEAETEKQYHQRIDRWTLRWNGITAIATIGLFLVGFGGVFAAVRTLQAIGKQSEIASNSQRSWIVPKGVSKPDLSGVWIMKVSCEFEVYGSSPVRVHESQIIFDFFGAIPVGNTGEVIPDLPEKPDYGEKPTTLSDSPEMGQVWAPGSPITVAPMLKGAIANQEQLQALRDGKNVLCLYGFISYRDAFDKSKMRTTRFCYICGKKGVLDTKYEEYFVLGGPPEYNEID